MSKVMATNEPKGGAALVAEAVERFLNGRTGIDRKGLDQAEIGMHHLVYDLPIEAVANGQGMEAPTSISSRFLLKTSAGLIAAAEVGLDGTQATELYLLNFGPMVTSTGGVIDQVKSEPSENHYEIALLRVAAIKLCAVRVTPLGVGGNERIYVLEPAPAGMKVGQAYTPAQFVTAAQPIARDLLNSVPGPNGMTYD